MTSKNMKKYTIMQASMDEKTIQLVSTITRDTIQGIYPHYYPMGAVAFFLSHHKENRIRQDIKNGSVYLLFHNEHNAVGTVTCKENEICRLFVLPEYQGRGYGSSLMRFAEETIFAVFASCRLDASLPAKAIYRKRGYREIESHVIPTEHGDFLCYDVMEKRKA